MCLWKGEVYKAREARARRDDITFEKAVHRLENLPPHAIRPPEKVRRELGLVIKEEMCTPSRPSPRCKYHRPVAQEEGHS